MHMADALISPVVGGIMWATSAGAASYSIKKIKLDLDEKKIPLMGVMGAFVFAAQMINFTIPGTGSSGHIGGGILLAILLGPYAGFLTMASVLAIQALFFADGGLLALGSNIFNLGFYTCFIAYPLIYKSIIKKGITKKRIFVGSLLASVIGLQLGSFSVVLQTFFSGITELPLLSFLLLMQPIHLAIGLIEGLITAAVVTFVWSARPEILEPINSKIRSKNMSYKKLIAVLLCSAVLIGSMLSWYASSNPDGLEWAIENITGNAELESSENLHTTLESFQEKISFLPDYSLKTKVEVESNTPVDVGTSVSGLIGGLLTLFLAISIGLVIKLFKNKRLKEN
ncbi:cobalamin biosynthesis protein CbiM [Alkalibaculum sp. M08DMB]|uniref:Cobalamin biosynthesis protein CbiM n=1 Tax=Alkalibaculum sporogenes TaxID=2655001 RepID=A0A6A7KBQ0_9FIRM|nr:energy-coupling factor ABC transporter permease [Alkalibaculum sporogenes]MPW26782.1 cobalamin biosynthesis protein CbiM [Alkalibaculum sporogenes]